MNYCQGIVEEVSEKEQFDKIIRKKSSTVIGKDQYINKVTEYRFIYLSIYVYLSIFYQRGTGDLKSKLK